MAFVIFTFVGLLGRRSINPGDWKTMTIRQNKISAWNSGHRLLVEESWWCSGLGNEDESTEAEILAKTAEVARLITT